MCFFSEHFLNSNDELFAAPHTYTRFQEKRRNNIIEFYCFYFGLSQKLLVYLVFLSLGAVFFSIELMMMVLGLNSYLMIACMYMPDFFSLHVYSRRIQQHFQINTPFEVK